MSQLRAGVLIRDHCAFDVSHAAARVRDVVGVSWDDVQVKVKNRLAGGLAAVGTHIVAGWPEFAVEELFDSPRIEYRSENSLLSSPKRSAACLRRQIPVANEGVDERILTRASDEGTGIGVSG